MTRTPQHDALLDAIAHDPDADLPRLVYADWLGDDHAEADPARAELIRVQVELAQYPRTGIKKRTTDLFGDEHREFHKWGAHRRQLRSRESALLREHEPRWRATEVCEACEKRRRRERENVTYPNCRYCHGLGRVGVLAELRWSESGDRHELVWSIPLTWNRGFPRVSVPVAWFCEEKITRYERDDGSMNLTNRDYPNARRLFAEQGYVEVKITDMPIYPSGGNDTYYVGNLGMFPSKFWSSLENHRTRSAALAALSRAASLFGRETARETTSHLEG